MKSATVNIKQIPTMEFRFDPSLHLSEGVKVRETLAELPYEVKPLSSVTERIFLGNIFSRIWVKDKQHGVPYLAASDTVLANLDTGQFLAKRQAIEMPYLVLKKGWILVTCSGTLGNTSYTNGNYAGRIATHDLIRVIPNEDELPGGYVYAFLSSKYGYYQITQSQFGGVVKHINATQAGQIQIPVLPKNLVFEADKKIKESARLREEAAINLNKAKDYFDSRHPIRRDTIKFFSKNIKDIRNNFAAYNNNTEVCEFVKSYSTNSFSLGSICDSIFAPPLFKHIYLSIDNGHPFITGGELTEQNQKFYRWLSPRGVRDISNYIVDEGTLVLYKSGSLNGMIGDVFMIDKHLNGCCLSDHVIRIKLSDKKLSFWIFAFLKSFGGVKLLKSLATGTAIPFIMPDYLNRVLIPKPDEAYDTITDYISLYLEFISKAKKLELEAISLVEAEIEKWSK